MKKINRWQFAGGNPAVERSGMFLMRIQVLIIKRIFVKRKMNVTRTSIIGTIDFMMAQTGINREQATIAFNTILHYMKQHPSEPLHKLVGYLVGHPNENGNSSLN